MPVLTTTGKNLYSGYEVGLLNTSTGVVDATSTNACTTNFINIKGREKLKTKLPGRCVVLFYDANKELVQTGWHEYSNANPTISIPNGYDLHYMRIRIRPGAESEAFKKITDVMVVDVSEDINSYEPYKSNILTVNDDVKLRGIWNVRDELNCLTGEVTERIGEIVFDGTEEWKNPVVYTNTVRYMSPKLENYKLNSKNVIMGNLQHIYNHNLDEPHCAIDVGGYLFVFIPKTELEDTTVNSVKKYFQKNNTKFQYELKTPTIKTVDLSILDQNENKVSSISSFNDTTHITASSETIPPIFEGYLATKEVE